MASEIQTKDNLRRKMFGEILERLLSRLLSRFKDVLAGTFSENK